MYNTDKKLKNATLQEPLSPIGDGMSTKMTNSSQLRQPINDGKEAFNNSRKPDFNLNPR